MAVSRRVRRYLKAILPLVFLVLFAAACSSDGFPISYTDQPNADGVSNVQANWTEGCTVGFADSELAAEANSICACSYAAISDANSGIPFEEFVELNNNLKGDPRSLATSSENAGSAEARLVDIVKNCIATN